MTQADHRLRRTLGLPDLVSMQILLVVGFTWFGIAARQGPTHVGLWLLGMVTFFLPAACVVQFCTRLWPLEGGVYQWTRAAMGPFAGFMSAWNFGAWAVLLVSSLGIVTATALRYALGPDAAWMASSTAFILGLNTVLFGFILAITITGLGVGRWIAHVGTFTTLSVIGLVMALAVIHPHATETHRFSAPGPAFSLAMPAATLISFNLFTKLTFLGLTGLEQVAIFAGETRNPGRAILRSAWIAAPLIATIYIVCTGSILTYTAPDKVDLNGSLPQLLATAFGGGAPVHGIDWARLLGAAGILGLAAAAIAQYSVIVAETSRLPMVAAWDRLIPGSFTRLHPRFGTPVLSLCVICGIAIGFAAFASLGNGAAEAFQVIGASANLFYGITYLLMFAVPLVVGTRFGHRPGLVLRAACVMGFAVTLAAMAFMVVPIVDVANVLLFAGKLLMTVLVVNGVGAFVYWRAQRLSSESRADVVRS